MVIASGIEADLIKRIQNTRRELLDLSARNRLISTPRASFPGEEDRDRRRTLGRSLPAARARAEVDVFPLRH